MKKFMDEEFLLDNEISSKLFHTYSEKLPIIDYHCHVSPKEIYENRKFNSLQEVWLGGKKSDGSYFGDHYKWRLMRSNGITEEAVTGDVDPNEKLLELAKVLELSIGNPMYTWCNLELKRFFGIEEPLNSRNVLDIVKKCDDKLKNDDNLTVRGIIKQSNVAFIGTTDDPIDDLCWHKKIKEDKTIDYIVAPSFRPDKAINITKAPFVEYIKKLGEVVNKKMESAEDVAGALKERISYFKSLGCRASDHGLDYIMYIPYTMDVVNKAFKKVMNGESISLNEAEQYQSYILYELGKEYCKQDIVMQLHYGCYRNTNENMMKKEGPDTGFDCILQTDCGKMIADLLSALNRDDNIPKTIIYSLNPTDNAMLDSLVGCFQGDTVPCKVQHGTAWWFNDHVVGMMDQMKSFAAMSVFGNFVGMLTDARSFLSYTRHELFRRIMCNYVGTMVNNGEYPYDEEALKKIVEGVSYYNAKRYFNI